jgi:hypothetical protein
MRAGYRLSLIFAVAMLPAWQANAQAPWPTDPPRAGAPAAPWPGAGGAPAPMPGTVAPPMPQMGAGPPPMSPGGSPFGGGPGPGAGAGGVPPCMAEFTKLREEVQKRGAAAKTASEHKATREEMCKQVTAYATAEAKWVKFTEASVSTCGIPPEIAKQLKTVHGHTEETKQKLCAAGPAAAAAAPSLSDALGTTRLPTPDTTKTGSGTLDTLTGNAIQR